MQQTFPWLIILAVGATLAVLVVGIVSMLRQGGFNARHSNRLMRYRVALQFIAIALVALAFILGR